MDFEESGTIAQSVWAQVEQFDFVYRPEFCLGYNDWLATEGPYPSESQPSELGLKYDSCLSTEELPPPKKRKLSLVLDKRQPLVEVQNSKTRRFISPVKEAKVKEAEKGVIPANTKHCNSWAVCALNAWTSELHFQLLQFLLSACDNCTVIGFACTLTLCMDTLFAYTCC